MKIKKSINFIIIFFLIFFTNIIKANSITEQRSKYEEIRQALKNNKLDLAYFLIKRIKKYPLYPDLKLDYLLKNIKNENYKTINKFLKKYPNLLRIQLVKDNFIKLLTINEDWKTLLMFSPNKPKNLNSCCSWYYAKFYYGNKKQVFIGIKNIWFKNDELPYFCKKIFLSWKLTKEFSTNIILERIYLAMKSKNDQLVRSLVRNLELKDYELAKLIINLWKNPLTLTNFIKKTKINNINKKFIILTLKKLTDRNINLARNIILFLIETNEFNNVYKQKLKEIITWKILENNFKNTKNYWCDNVIKNSKSIALIERRLRLAIYRNNIYDIKYWINKLPKLVREKPEWQYWKADVLIKLGFIKKGNNILKKLLYKNNFYSIVTAQRLHIKNPIRINKNNFSIKNIKINELARIQELIYWKYNNLAINEWDFLIKQKQNIIKNKLAFYANNKCWWHLSVRATIKAKAWNNLKERFPLAWKEYYYFFTLNKDIDQGYAMSIARQESAWNPDAFSSSGAIGLMQIMPITAQDIIKIYNMKMVISNIQLFNPLINIEIGTQYLEYLYKKTGKNRIFSSIAFNAGLSRLRKWQKNRINHDLNVIAFIETIPFKETRNYVKQVLTYNVYYNYLLGKSTKIFTKNEWNFRY